MKRNSYLNDVDDNSFQWTVLFQYSASNSFEHYDCNKSISLSLQFFTVAKICHRFHQESWNDIAECIRKSLTLLIISVFRAYKFLPFMGTFMLLILKNLD